MKCSRIGYWVLIAFSLVVLGCATNHRVTRSTVSETLKKGTGFDLSKQTRPGVTGLPSIVDPSDGITEDEAVSIALWNNAQFQTDLAAISIAQADIVDAGVVSNPLLRYLAPNGAIMASGYINFAFDFLFQRPQRIGAAQIEASRVAENMLQKGYALIRDAQTAYTDLLLARQRVAIVQENARIRREMAQLANSRLRNGDISELEVTTFRADSAAAVEDLVKAVLDTLLKKNALNVVLGFSPDTTIVLQPTSFGADTQRIVQQTYMQLAYDYQPELKAAQINIESIGKRLGWERSRMLAFTGVLNYQHLGNGGGSKWLPNAFNPGIQVELPILNRNQGKIARAEAEMEQAAFQYVAIRQRIALEVANSYDRYDQAWQSYQTWNNGVLRALEETVRLSQSSYRNGDISYLPVLEALRQLTNGKLRKVEIEAEIRRAISGLNYFIGNKWNNN